MSDAQQLEKEIQYWSVLIQRHKEAKVNQRKNIETIASKYSWRKTDSAAHRPHTRSQPSSPRVNVNHNVRKRNYSGKAYSRHPQKKAFGKGSPPTPAMMATTTGVSFKSKFKWSKETQTGLANQNVSSLKTMIPSTSATKASLTAGTSLTHSVVKSPAPSKPQGVQSAASHEASIQSYTDKGSAYRYVAPGAVKCPAKDKKKAQKISPSHTLEWSRESHKKSPNDSYHTRRSSKLSVSGRPSKHSPQRVVGNPYKLNRTVKASITTHHKKISDMHQSHKSRFTYRRRNSLTLDRRQKLNSLSYTANNNRRGLNGQNNHKPTSTVQQTLASRAILKSHLNAKARLLKREKKKQHCLYYGRFGKCMRGDDCKFIHDPSRVTICTRFLRGTCRDENCSFSHKLEKEKIPVCIFFLLGKCSAKECPYLHVYLGKNAPVCRRFATSGYCADADQCKMLHMKCCPDYYESGACTKGKECRLPHVERKMHSVVTTKNDVKGDEVDKQGDGDLLGPGADNKPNAKSSTSLPDFLSLKVDSSLPINKPVKGGIMHIKPRLNKLKPGKASTS